MNASSMISAPRLATLVAVVCASLTIVPAAMASVMAPPDRVDGLGGANPTSHSVTVMPQSAAAARAFHAHQLAVAPLGPQRSATVRTDFTPPPDRVDGLGSSRFTTATAPVPASTSANTSSSFDWTAALIGALAGLGIGLLAMVAWVTHSRRHVALKSA
jgi:hypothetical protein